jgi:S-adenosylmethionine/arginine decarboxylase-like enzyme
LLVHKHLIVRAEIKKPITDEQQSVEWVQQLIDAIGMRVMLGPYAKYLDVQGNRGLTVAAIIETSHVCAHIWDETDPAVLQLDIYTCGPLDTAVVFKHLQQLEPVKVEYKYLDREHGLLEQQL